MIMRVIKGILDTASILYIAVLALIILPGFAGIEAEAVISGSMEPAIRTGSVVYVKKAAFDVIQTGDVITYYLKESGIRVTHRVVEKNEKEQTFLTKGDANEKNDMAEVAFNRVAGKVILVIPYIGRIAILMTNIHGKVLLIAVLLMLELSGLLADAVHRRCFAGLSAQDRTEKSCGGEKFRKEEI